MHHSINKLLIKVSENLITYLSVTLTITLYKFDSKIKLKKMKNWMKINENSI